MRNLFMSDSYKETQLHTFNPQSWLQVERGKLSLKFSSHSPNSIKSLIKVAEPQLLPLFKPIDYVEVLAQIHEELELCPPEERSKLYLLQFQVCKDLGELKLLQRSLRSALEMATTVYERLIFGAWLKYEKQGEEPIYDLLASCGKCSQEFEKLNISSQIPVETAETLCTCCNSDASHSSTYVTFRIGEEMISCDWHKIAAFSTPFHTMLECALEENSPVLAASCLRLFLHDLPD